MSIIYEERQPDTPFVETIWRTRVISDGCDDVSADVCWDMLLVIQDDKIKVSIWGPMTKTTPIPHVEGQEWLGIRFKLGTFMPHLPADKLVNQGITLPRARCNSFWLSSSTWETPNYENAETFVNRLIREGLLYRDTVVEASLQGHSQDISSRTLQRRFQRVTGLTQRTVRAIERARQAVSLLRSGMPILDVVYQTGYADQQTMTKSLKHLIGLTPAQIARIRTYE
jgi:AraC-like DNA-binding protein